MVNIDNMYGHEIFITEGRGKARSAMNSVVLEAAEVVLIRHSSLYINKRQQERKG